MQLVTVGSRYQIVIPKEVRKKVKDIIPGAKVAVGVEKKRVTIEPKQKNWSDRTYGIMAEAWKGIDPAAEIDKMRDEWEEKVREMENELKKI